MTTIITNKSKGNLFGSKILQKKVPRNSKYDKRARSAINTGKNVKNFKPKADRRAEEFNRINRTELHTLIKRDEQKNESVYDLPLDDSMSVMSVVTTDSFMSFPEGKRHKRKLKNLHDIEYILLDLREESDFNECHIVGAVHWTAAQVRRDKYTTEMYQYKNRDNKIIAMYANDERTLTGSSAAQLLAKKGFDNIYLLTGGLVHFANKYHARVEGNNTDKFKPKTPTTKRSGRSKSSLAASPGSGSVRGSARAPPRGSLSSHGRRSPRDVLRQQQHGHGRSLSRGSTGAAGAKSGRRASRGSQSFTSPPSPSPHNHQVSAYSTHSPSPSHSYSPAHSPSTRYNNNNNSSSNSNSYHHTNSSADGFPIPSHSPKFNTSLSPTSIASQQPHVHQQVSPPPYHQRTASGSMTPAWK